MYVVVDKETDGYRGIGKKDLEFISAMDMAKKERGFNILKEIEKHNDKITAEHKQKLRNTVMDAARERWRQFAGNPLIPVNIDLH